MKQPPDLPRLSVEIALESLPEPANENLHVMSEGRTPEEFAAWLQRTKREMRQELAADFSLRSCPTHRRIWEQVKAIERCFLWHQARRR